MLALAMSVLSRVLWVNSPFQLLLDNGALFMLEVVSYACAIFMVLHALGSPRRSRIVLGTIFVYHVVLLGLGRVDADVTITWYAQGMIMLGGGHLPLYLVVLHTLFYYVAYITTQRLHLQDYASACVFVVIVVGLNFPLELMGPKFILWTFHDTEPTLKERFLSIPIAILLAHIASALSFYSTLWGAISLGLKGHLYHDEQAVAEHIYPIASILVSIPLSVFYFAMLFHLVCDLLLIQPQILLLALVALSVAIIWTCDRLGGDLGPPQIPPWVYDGEWTSAWYDHALVQAVFLYTGILALLTLVINPTRLTSLSFHQRLGDCSIDTNYMTLLATTLTRAMYLCSKAYDEEFTLCNVPSSQLYMYEPWYAICGRKYEHKAFPNYLVCMLVATTAIVLGLRAAYSVLRPTYVQRFVGPKA